MQPLTKRLSAAAERFEHSLRERIADAKQNQIEERQIMIIEKTLTAVPTDKTSGAALLTYRSLIAVVCVDLRQSGKSNDQIKIVRATIKSWCRILNISIDLCVGSELTAEFSRSLKIYIDRAKRINKKSTYSSRVSILRNVRKFYLQKFASLPLPETFGARLVHLLKLRNYTAKKFWRHYLQDSIGYGAFCKWLNNSRMPHTRNKNIVEKIEASLELAPKTLSSTLITSRVLVRSTETSAYSKRLSANFKKKYWVWTAKLNAEFKRLVAFKSAVVLPPGTKRQKKAVWTSNEPNKLPTADAFKSEVRSYCGFLKLPIESADPMLRGRGVGEEQLSLAHFADAAAVEEYVTVFQKARADNKYTGGSLRFLCSATSLLRKETGFLYQNADLGIAADLAHNKKEWQARCVKTRNRLIEIKHYIEQEKAAGGSAFGFGRDPQEPIRLLLQLERPLLPLVEMVKRMLADANKLKNGSRRQAVLFRDALLIAMLQANPLRILMFSKMQLGRHLKKNKDDSWWIEFKRVEFKNRHSLKSDYKVRLVPDLWHLIDEYLEIYRPKLLGADAAQYVFLPFYQLRKPDHGFRMGTMALSKVVKRRTRDYIPGCCGFPAHCFRYLVASSITRENPAVGFFLAAKVLNDKLETVEAHYAHLRTGEYFEPYNNLFSKIWRSVGASKNSLLTAQTNDVNEADDNEENLDNESQR